MSTLFVWQIPQILGRRDACQMRSAAPLRLYIFEKAASFTNSAGRMTVALMICDCGLVSSCGYSHIGPSCGGMIAAGRFMRQRRRRRAQDAKGNPGAKRLRSE